MELELPSELSLGEMAMDEFPGKQYGSSVSSLRSQQVPPHTLTTPLLPPRVSTHCPPLSVQEIGGRRQADVHLSGVQEQPRQIPAGGESVDTLRA